MNNYSQIPVVAALNDFVMLTKPRVNALIMLTALVGSVLASFDHTFNSNHVFLALLGIAMVAAAAAAFNCLVEIAIDSVMKRTSKRPLPNGRLTHTQAVMFIVLLSGTGVTLTTLYGGLLTGILTVITFFGYAIIYTLFLKKATPQNIVIGGASGAMPPLLGWCAVTGDVGFEAMLLFLIIFVWTPPHFWALAIYRQEDYKKSGLPMLPVTHGAKFTAIHIVFYSVVLFIITLLPYLSQMAGLFYLVTVLLLNSRFLYLACKVYKTLDLTMSRKLFTYSITYLGILFCSLIIDRLLPLNVG